MGNFFKDTRHKKVGASNNDSKAKGAALRPQDRGLWGSIASKYRSYITRSGNYHETLIIPNVLRLLAVREGERVLDLACGEGTVSRMIAGRGARVLAVDESARLIALAKKSSGAGVEYRVAPAHDLGRVVPAASCDAAVIVLALENIEHYREALASCARALSSSGRLIIVLNHPAFRVPKRSSWHHDEKRRIMYRRVDGYLSESAEKIEMEPEKKDGDFVIAYHRPLQAYAKALERAGFVIERMEEWTSHRKSEGSRAEEENRARREFPLFLAIRALKRNEK